MRSVLKYPAPPPDVNWEFDRLPKGEIVHFGLDKYNRVCVWLLIEMDPDPTEPAVHDEATYRIYGTGHEIEDGFEHVISAICHPFVWHLFRRNA